jgi:hypothetical protein
MPVFIVCFKFVVKVVDYINNIDLIVPNSGRAAGFESPPRLAERVHSTTSEARFSTPVFQRLDCLKKVGVNPTEEVPFRFQTA